MEGRRISLYKISLFWVTVFGLVFNFAPVSGRPNDNVCATTDGECVTIDSGCAATDSGCATTDNAPGTYQTGGQSATRTSRTIRATMEARLPSAEVDALLPLPGECGIESTEDRIVGGNVTNIDQYPWMGLVEYRTKQNTISLACGATLISKRYAITAGHCLYGDVLTQAGTPINVRFGEFDQRTLIDCVKVVSGEDCNEEPVTIAIEKIIAHPNYNPNSKIKKNDIGLFRLASDAPYTDFIRPICLPTSDITVQGSTEDLIVAGWGVTETGNSSDVKLHLAIPFVTMAECQHAYSGSIYPNLKAELWDMQVCAGGQAGKDSCRGDSGGPLMSMTDAHWSLHGVVSFGPKPCGLADVPAVYTKVYSYISWIRQQIQP